MQKLGNWGVQICECTRQGLKVIPCFQASKKRFWKFFASLSAAGRRHPELVIFGGDRIGVIDHLLPVTQEPRVPFLQLGVCQGSCISGRSGKDVEERHPGGGRNPGLGFYNMFLVQMVIRRMKTCDWSLFPPQVCDDHKAQDVNSLISSGSHQERTHNILY